MSSPKPEEIWAVIDTNILLHYRWPEDWDSPLTETPLKLIFVPLIFRELEKRRYQDTSERMRERARSVLRRLTELFDAGTEVRLRNGIVAAPIGTEPALSFADHSLSREIADDYLIAHLIELSADGRRVALLSADGPAAFKAKLRGIRVIRPDAAYLLPVEPTREDRELQQLRAEKVAQPKLSLTMVGARKLESISYACQLLDQWTSMDRSEILAQFTSQLRGIPAGSRRPSDLAILRENDAKIKSWTRYLGDLDRYRRQVVLELPFAIWNGGMRSAENVHVMISMRLKATLTDEAPAMPTQESYEPDEYGVGVAGVEPPRIRDLRLETISSENGVHAAAMTISLARQEYTAELPALYLVFADEDDLTSFNCEWEIRASNIGAPVRGRLNVIIDKIPHQQNRKQDLPVLCKPEPQS
jgi:hypothetical protein